MFKSAYSNNLMMLLAAYKQIGYFITYSEKILNFEKQSGNNIPNMPVPSNFYELEQQLVYKLLIVVGLGCKNRKNNM